MKKILELIKKINTNENFVILMSLIVLLQPIIDIDYLLFPILDKIGIPLPSTVFYFIGMPFVILLTFFLKEENKKKTFLFASIYGTIIIIYFVFHHINVKDLFDTLYLTNRYDYIMSTEIRYIVTLIIPFGLIYAFYKTEFTQKTINKIVIWSSILIAGPIFVSNLFLFGLSTYYDGYTLANFPTWFFGIYETHLPKYLTTRFFFSEGNTTGIILFSIYPILIRQIFSSNKKWFIGALIIIQGWAMYILATRVATYGVLLMLGFSILVYLFLVILKKEKFNWKPLLALLLIFSSFFVTLSYTPAVRNLEIDNRNDLAVYEDEELRLGWKDQIEPDEELIPGTEKFNYYYQNIFEQYYWLLTLPDIYYKWYYPYYFDPKFYVDLIFEYDFFERQNGRQFQKIFFDYKWAELTANQKLFGFSYSRFMYGSILLEQDFIMQVYTLGYIGSAILTFPWIGILLYMVYKALKSFKYIFDYDLIVLVIAFGSILGGAYLSGHVLDQFFSSTYLAFFASVILFKLNRLMKEE